MRPNPNQFLHTFLILVCKIAIGHNWPQNTSKFFLFAKVLREFRETFAEEFCNIDGMANFFLRVEIILEKNEYKNDKF